MLDRVTEDEIDELTEAFENHTLDKRDWTHEAHIAVCRSAVRRYGRTGALVHLRQAISSYNEATGGRNTSTDGYHETLTRYYVDVVAERVHRDLVDLLNDPECSRDAPLRLWTSAVLFSPEARRRWVPPDRISVHG